MAIWSSEFYDLYIIFADGTEHEVAPSDFTVSVPGFVADDREISHVYDRETHVEAVRGRVKAYELSVEVFQDGPLSSTGGDNGLMDAISFTGDYSTETTVDPGGLAKAVHMELRGARLAKSETIRFTRCYLSGDLSMSMEGNRISLKGDCRGGITRTPAT